LVHIPYKEESFKIIGACTKVHRELGLGFLEAVYEEALEKEFIKGNIPYRRQTLIQIYYESEPLKKIIKPILYATKPSF
jgi:GxxExxY protein